MTALKRLAAVHGTREEVVDDLLRGGRLVDLYAVVRKALRVSQRSYSIKYLEPLYMPSARDGDVKTAVSSIEAYEEYLALKQLDDPRAGEVLRGISDYNEYDCVSTLGAFPVPAPGSGRGGHRAGRGSRPRTTSSPRPRTWSRRSAGPSGPPASRRSSTR